MRRKNPILTIENREQLNHSLTQLARLYNALDSLKDEAATPAMRALLAEGPINMIQDILAEINEYVGMAELEAAKIQND